MKGSKTAKLPSAVLAVIILAHVLLQPACAQLSGKNPTSESPQVTAQATASATPAESTANSSELPTQILRTGINLTASGVSPNSIQLANTIRLTPILDKIQASQGRVDTLSPSPERLEARLELLEAKSQANALIARTNLEIDFAMAEMTAEQNVYNEILSSFAANRDKLLARVNAASFISNGILWAICEGMSIPSINTNFAKEPKHVAQWPIPSGIVGIAAGIVPSIASMYTLKAVNGKKKTSEVEPNMLAKLFNYPVHADIEYPASVWLFLNQVPATEPKSKTRREQLVDRWIADSNIPGFTNRNSTEQLDVVTACVAQKKGLSIATLSTRLVMLQQLSAEVVKMKRMLLELAMVVQGDKQFVAAGSGSTVTPTSTMPQVTPNTIPKNVTSSTLAPAEKLTAQSMNYSGVP